MKYHTIDRFSWGGNLNCLSELKFGVGAGGKFVFEVGKVKVIDAELKAQAFALWKIANENQKFKCDYQGMYVLIYFIDNSPDKNNDTRKSSNGKNNKASKFLLHDGFSYEFKID